MYVKDDAIDAMLHQKLNNEFWMVSANVINHAGGFSFATAPAGLYSWHHKSAYTRLHFCSLEPCCASQTDI